MKKKQIQWALQDKEGKYWEFFSTRKEAREMQRGYSRYGNKPYERVVKVEIKEVK